MGPVDADRPAVRGDDRGPAAGVAPASAAGLATDGAGPVDITFNAPADQAWPWTPPLALGSIAVLAVVVARVDRPVLVWVVAISTVPVLGLVDPDNRVPVLLLLGALAIVVDLIRTQPVVRRPPRRPSRASGSRSAARCWRNAPGSPGRCTTWWRTTCR